MRAPPPAILALDLGTTTGWAIRDGDVINSGVISFAPRRFEGGGMVFVRFRAWLNEIDSNVNLTAVYFEEVRRHIGTDAAHKYGGFLATLSSWCETHKIPYSGIPVGTIKKQWTGKGNAGKTLMIQEGWRRGFRPADNNEADALAILHCLEVVAGPGVEPGTGGI